MIHFADAAQSRAYAWEDLYLTWIKPAFRQSRVTFCDEVSVFYTHSSRQYDRSVDIRYLQYGKYE
jgi:hypothetical protein